MKIFKRVLTVLIAVIVLALAAGMIYLNSLKTRAVPDYNADVDLENLTEPVTVYRDSFGIPHIYANNELDLYRTTGYVMAQDRLWQMDLMRRLTTGRLAEIMGEDLIGADHLFRSLNFPAKSRKLMEITDPKLLSIYEAFADGINQYMETHRKKLSFEFALLGYEPDPWEVSHTINLIGYLAWDLQSGWKQDMDLFKISRVVEDSLLKELIPDMDFQNSMIFPDYFSDKPELELVSNIEDGIAAINQFGLKVFQASNSWAISGARSETGMPLMANDMHLGLMSPGVWYQMHHIAEGEINVTGVVLPGVPFVICGHNENIAWGMTNVTVDNVDFYLETINPDNENQYLVDGKWRDMKIVEEEILVKDMDPVIKTIKYTHRGPIISTIKGIEERAISSRWSGSQTSDELRTVYLLDKASNWDEFRDALSTFMTGNQNVVYADKDGNIGLQTAAGLPIRKGNGVLVYPGDTSLYDWKGLVPFEELPYSYNPEIGYVSSANNRTVGDDYPYHIGNWFAIPYRIERIREMLNAEDVMGADYFKMMLADHNSHYARKMVPVYIEALSSGLEGTYQNAFDLISGWNFEMSATSAEALLFEITDIELTRSIFKDELGDDLINIMYNDFMLNRHFINKILITGKSAWCDDITTLEKKETFYENIRSAFTAAVDSITVWYGEDMSQWRWGDLHTITLEHPMGSVAIVDKLFKVNKGPYPIGGSWHTVCPYKYPIGSSFKVDDGASERHIFNTADWDASLTVIPTGTSGIPASPHYLDQTELYVNNQFHRDHFSREAVETNMKYRAVFD